MIAGLQKMTLLDYPGKVACTVFLQGCNFACPFCHNSPLLPFDAQPFMEEAALLAFLQKRQGILEGVCITGGEPTLYPGLENLLRQIKALGYGVKLDTNGSRPEILKELVAEGLVDGYESEEFGYTITAVDGIYLDWAKDNAYWALYEGDAYATESAAGIVLVDGAVYRLVYESF
jgi:pyruvate formate lyase activating enzyme